MRHRILFAAVAAAVSGPLFSQTPDATQVLSAAREALGGEKKLSAVRSFVATGRTRQLRGNNLVPIEFEISCELPDKFVRTDEIPAQDTDPTTLGFNGEELIQLPPPAQPPAGAGGGRGGGPPRLIGVKQDFARLALGMFAASFSSYPLTFKYAAVGEAPEGQADILDVAGPANFSARFVVQRATHLPVMLMWQMPAGNVIVRVPGQPAPATLPPGAVVVDAPAPPAASASQEERDKYAAAVAALRKQAMAQAKPIEHRIYYADFRDVDGMKWPFRIRRAVAGETIEETTFDRFRVNPKIDPRKFTGRK